MTKRRSNLLIQDRSVSQGPTSNDRWPVPAHSAHHTSPRASAACHTAGLRVSQHKPPSIGVKSKNRAPVVHHFSRCPEWWTRL
jgi:hypothetical protein